MDAALIERIETSVERIASALCAGAVVRLSIGDLSSLAEAVAESAQLGRKANFGGPWARGCGFV